MIYLTCKNMPDGAISARLYERALAEFDPSDSNAQYIKKLSERIEKSAAESLYALILLAELLQLTGASARELKLQFCKNESGKPCFENSIWKFNVSHSGGYVAVVLSDEGEVGIDIETADVDSEKAIKLAKRFFTETERQAVQKCPSSFCELWSAKEARAKYLGVSLASFMELERSKNSNAAHNDISTEKHTACGVPVVLCRQKRETPTPITIV